MHKMLKTIALLVIASMVLAACGGTAATPTTAPVAATSTPVAVAASPTTAMMATPTTASSGGMETPTMAAAMTPTVAMMETPTMATGVATATMAAETPTMAGPAGPTDTPAPTATPIPPVASNPNAKTTVILWTKEGEPTLSWINDQAKKFSASAAGKDINIVVVNKGVEDIKGQFPNALAANDPSTTPDFLWTVGDHVGVFAPGSLIADVDTAFGAGYNDKFLTPAADAAKYNGKSWGVPLSAGNHLMLLYNKKLVPNAPKNSDEMIAMAKAITTGSGNNAVYGLVYNQSEPFWLNPFLAGFGGWPLANPDDATKATGTLDTPEMVKTLQFLQDLKFKDKIMPAEADYNTADQLFKDGRAGMLINGDWSLSGYLTDSVKSKLDLGIAPIPQISGGEWPAPMVAGVYIMVAAPTVDNKEKLAAVKAFTDYLTSKEVQLDFAKTQNRLPALTDANSDAAITGDAVLSAASAALQKGKPQPVVPQMRCAFDAEKTPLQDVMANKQTPAAAAKAMQDSYNTCAKDIK